MIKIKTYCYYYIAIIILHTVLTLITGLDSNSPSFAPVPKHTEAPLVDDTVNDPIGPYSTLIICLVTIPTGLCTLLGLFYFCGKDQITEIEIDENHLNDPLDPRDSVTNVLYQE